jgi:hypothetical protein
MKRKVIKGGSVTTDAQTSVKVAKAPSMIGKAKSPTGKTSGGTTTRVPSANNLKMKEMSSKPAPKARDRKRGTPVAMPTKTTKDFKGKPRVQSGGPKKIPKPAVKPKSKMTPEDKAYNDLLNKYKGDVTKIPGFKYGRGTR